MQSICEVRAIDISVMEGRLLGVSDYFAHFTAFRIRDPFEEANLMHAEVKV